MLNRTSKSPLAWAMISCTMLLASCASGEAEHTTDANEQASAAPSADRLPACDDIAKAIGAPVAGMGGMPDAESGPWRDGDKYGVKCTWGTSAAIRVANGQPGSVRDIGDMGTVTLHIGVNDNVMTESEVRSAGKVFDDPRAKAIGGWIMADPGLDLAAKAALAPPQVNVGATTISVGAANSSAPELASITNDWAIDAAVATYRLIDKD
ncbi:hypothetical protein ACBY01_15575 [Sphingomonas sp. ac-8]|uniref:hypothetical protein n=1 Tax=Sphingomonas sp. ac-8 TaxID=3242977 RepID=UPI003A7FDF8A